MQVMQALLPIRPRHAKRWRGGVDVLDLRSPSTSPTSAAPSWASSTSLILSPSNANMDDADVSPAAAAVNNGVHVDGEPSSPIQASGAMEAVPAPAVNPAVAKVVDDVLYSDIGVNALLARLKQSI